MPKYPFKTNEFIEEEVDVPSFEPVVNEKKKRVEFRRTTVKATRKTMFVDSKPRRVICKDHKYFPIDKGKYTFKCMNCDWHRIAPPITFKFDQKTGKLTYRETGVPA